MIGAIGQVGSLFDQVLQNIVAIGVLCQRVGMLHQLISKLIAQTLNGAVLKHALHYSAAVAVFGD